MCGGDDLDDTVPLLDVTDVSLLFRLGLRCLLDLRPRSRSIRTLRQRPILARLHRTTPHQYES